ncbi:MAG: hypothetical protein H7249_07735 [Chitinophagaceae bacterium]|nr:hypothetical protein [Oligoflexus sp.]
MKSLLKSTIFAIAMVSPSLLFAHEGHDHAPGQLVSQNGGVVKSGKEMNLEMVTEGAKVSFYPLAHTGEKIAVSDVKISATAQSPKGKPAPLKLESNGSAYIGIVELAGAVRSTVEVKATYQGKTDIFKFQVENQ